MSLFKRVCSKIVIGDDIECYPITLDNIGTLEMYYSCIKKMEKICSYAMQGSLIFGGNNYYNIVDDYLFLFHYNQNKVSFVTIPFDKNGNFMKLSKVYDYMKKHNIYRIRCVLNTDLKNDNSLIILKKYFEVKPECNEYFYDNKKISMLEGKDFSKMRNKLNKFNKDNIDISYRWGTNKDKDILKLVYNKWKNEWNGLKYAQIFDGKYFDSMLKLGCEYFLIFFDSDLPIGFMGYYPCNRNIVHCGFRKLDINYQYLTQYAQVKFCEELYRLGYRYTNDDSDNNSKGLKELKTSFHPIHIMKQYQLILKDKE